MMPCNPHIGGSAKGIVVREIDALGGMMGKVADKTLLQMKMLNYAKGPAVRSLRSQGDKVAYPKEMQRIIKENENIEIIEDMVEDLIVEDNTIKGVILSNNEKIYAKSVILTTGTYMKADILVGSTRRREGPSHTGGSPQPSPYGRTPSGRSSPPPRRAARPGAPDCGVPRFSASGGYLLLTSCSPFPGFTCAGPPARPNPG